MPPQYRFLVAESEPPEEQQQRQEAVGRTAGETYSDLLRRLAPGSRVSTYEPLRTRDVPTDLAAFDAVFLTGSPLHLRHETDENRPVVEFMKAVFASGTPSFGSCAGLQIATVSAGGSVRKMVKRQEAGFGRRIFKTDLGRTHPLLDRRPMTYDAPAIHSDEVERLPGGSALLASSDVTDVQAAEISFGAGTFWGVQYHPELTLCEVAIALRRQADDLVECGLAHDAEDVAGHADLVEKLGCDPANVPLAWRLGLDQQVTDRGLRSAEIGNFIEHLVRAVATKRGRGSAARVESSAGSGPS